MIGHGLSLLRSDLKKNLKNSLLLAVMSKYYTKPYMLLEIKVAKGNVGDLPVFQVQVSFIAMLYSMLPIADSLIA